MSYPAITTFGVPGQYSSFIPSYTGYDGDSHMLAVDWAKDPKDFPINEYAYMHTVKAMRGLYPRFLAEDMVSVIDITGNDSIWQDGTKRSNSPLQNNNPRLTNIEFFITRYTYKESAGYLTCQEASYDYKSLLLNRLLVQGMTRRTLKTVSLATDSTQYQSAHVSTATSLGGGFFTAGTVAAPTIAPAFGKIRSQILKDTNNKVKLDQFVAVISPDLATAMSQSQEIRAYLSNQVGSLDILQGKDPNAATNWLLPNPLYGFKIVIEPTTYTTGPQQTNAARTPTYVLDSNTMFVCAKPGSISSMTGSASFSTLAVLELEGHAFKTFTADLGELDQMYEFYMEDAYQSHMVAPESGYLVTNCQS